jgi:MSHA biogenesis protein MshJ
MKKIWEPIALRIDALSLRERAMVFVALAAVLIFGFNAAVLKPQLAAQKRAVAAIQQDRATIASLRAEIQRMANRPDPNAENHARLEQLQGEVLDVKQAIQDVQRGLVSPNQMPALLQDLLRRTPGLKLVSLKTLPVTSLEQSASGGAAKPTWSRNRSSAMVWRSLSREATSTCFNT